MTSKKVIILSVVGLLVLALVIGAVVFFVMSNKDKQVEVDYLHYDIGEMYTNIKDADSILKVNITIEYTDENLTQDLKAKHSKITNGILELLRSRTIEELNGAKGQQNTRVDIRSLVRETLKSEKISDIFFVEFIIQ